MRLLPRTARGTWLLTAAAWVGGCVALWYALPEVPRATLRLPIDADLVGFGPNGRNRSHAAGHRTQRRGFGLAGASFRSAIIDVS